MGELNDLKFDAFDVLINAIQKTTVSIQEFADAIIGVFGNFPPFPDVFEDEIYQFRIDNNLWDAVDFDRLTPEQRWQYQKWVWGAPARWVRNRINPHP